MAMIDVVKYNGGPDVFAWKFPGETLNSWTQLIVNEAQEAILFKGGRALDIFGPGHYTLDTENTPLLRTVCGIPFGGKTPFTAEVWYINKTHSLNIKWGTPSPIQLQDPKYKIFVPLRSYGQFGIQITDAKQFLSKLVGTLPVFDKGNITKYFRGLYLTKAKDAISSYLIRQNVSVLEINAYLDELSAFLMERISPALAEYGIELLNFYVNDINVPEQDPAVIKLKNALSKRAEMDIVGYHYTGERSFDTLEGAATNPGSSHGGVMGAGPGLGMGAGLGGAVGDSMATMTRSIHTESPFKKSDDNSLAVCPECGGVYAKGYKFCPHCGTARNPCPHCGANLKAGQSSCSRCGRETPKPCTKCGLVTANAKFCPECGEAMQRKCGGCGAVIGGDPKFCPECGTGCQLTMDN